MRLLVCGNRDWTCVKTIDAWMRAVFFAAARAGHDEFVLIEGEAEGADTIAAAIFDRVIKAMFDKVPDGRFNVEIMRFPVHAHEWQSLGKRAGIGRLTKPDSGADSGTGNMVKICNQGGIVVTVVPNPGVLP